MTLADLLPDVLGRIEENDPTGDPPGPVFWDLTGEVYPQMVDGMFEASLITGVVQMNNVPVILSANTTYFSFNPGLGFGEGGFGQGGFGGGVLPPGIIAAIRLKAPYPIKKNSLSGLDNMLPFWQKVPPSTQMRAWFPLGVSGFGIYPQYSEDTTVIMDFLVSPASQARPYSGATAVPFQNEFTDAFSQYGAAMLRCKEGGAEAEEASVVYQEYMSQMKALSAFQGRLDSLVFSAGYGAKSTVNPRKVV